MDNDSVSIQFADRLRLEGVMYRGYGIIYKFPMLDPELNINAKAIYALICALADGDTAFPSREKTMSLLGMAKDTYYKGLNQLTDQGYIRVAHTLKANGQFGSNIYTIVDNPKKMAEREGEDDEKSSSTLSLGSQLSFTGIKSAGYGMLPRAVMFDKRLSKTAKVLYAYLASYSGAGKVSFPSKKSIKYRLGIGEATYQRKMSELLNTNYITVVQKRISGRLGCNEYYLNSNPDETSVQRKEKHPSPSGADGQAPVLTSSHTGGQSDAEGKSSLLYQKQDTAQQDTVNQDTAVQDTEKQDTVKQDITIIRTPTNSFSITNPSINKRQIPSEIELIDWMDPEEQYQYITENLDLDILYPDDPYNVSRVRDLIKIVIDFISSRKKILRINKVEHDRGEVIERLLDLNYEDYVYVLRKVDSVKGEIKNLSAYYLACLFVAKEDQEREINRRLSQDMNN